MIENNNKSFLEIEDDLNIALRNIGNNETKIFENKSLEMTVQELLDKLKIDEFEKIYIITAAQNNAFNKDSIQDDKLDKVCTLAEYKLSQLNKKDNVDLKDIEKLKNASNFYLIPHLVNQKINVGNKDQFQQKEIYTINDNEGYSLYTIIDKDNVAMTSGFKKRIENYLNENYSEEIKSNEININSIIYYFTPNSIDDLYNLLENDYMVSARYLPDRVDDYLKSKGIINKDKEDIKDSSEEFKNNEIEEKIVLEKNDDYIEKIAKLNRVDPVVVNTRVIENFEKVEEDTGIPLRGRYKRGEVIAVRIPYKLGYRTFLVEKNTGMTIDGRGSLDRKNGRLYDFDEIEDYFRYNLIDGSDGGKNGIPLRKDEQRDYITFIDNTGDIKEQKFINNGSKKDMLRDERERYLYEVKQVDEKLKKAIENYQKFATKENYQKVRDIIKEKVNIDNKYNALDKQREVTKTTIKNTREIIEKDDEDEWFPGMRKFH